jgi:SAM-dependent methyltransferase
MDVQVYDSGWEDRWDDMKRYGPYSRHVRRWIHHLIAPLNFTSVLDAGCGQGEMLREIQAHYPQVNHVAGIDFSPTSVEITRQRISVGRFEVIDLQTEHLDAVYDLTLSIDVMEHIPDDQAALINLRRMTGKYTLVSSIQGNFLPQWEADTVGHVRNYRHGELIAKMEQAGFVIERVIEWGFPFYSPLYRWLLTFLSGGGTDGSYGYRRKLLATLLYTLFLLNSSRRGDLILVLARPKNHV